MNRRYILLCFLALTMTAFGQKANPYLCQLEEYFKNQDRSQIWYSQANYDAIGHTWHIEFNEQLTPSDIDAIRNAFANARKDASESYMYEYHKDGTDSIKYSLLKSNNRSMFFDVDKALFDYDALKAEYYYYHEYYEPNDVNQVNPRVYDLGNADQVALLKAAREDNGDVYGGGKGIAGDRYVMAHCANSNNTVVIINYPNNNATPENYKPTYSGSIDYETAFYPKWSDWTTYGALGCLPGAPHRTQYLWWR